MHAPPLRTLSRKDRSSVQLLGASDAAPPTTMPESAPCIRGVKSVKQLALLPHWASLHTTGCSGIALLAPPSPPSACSASPALASPAACSGPRSSSSASASYGARRPRGRRSRARLRAGVRQTKTTAVRTLSPIPNPGPKPTTASPAANTEPRTLTLTLTLTCSMDRTTYARFSPRSRWPSLPGCHVLPPPGVLVDKLAPLGQGQDLVMIWL